MDSLIAFFNYSGEAALRFAWLMLWQSSLLIGVLFLLDFALRRKVRAAVRYGLWLVLMVKLVLPPSLALPTSLAWWLRSSPPPTAVAQPKLFTVTYGPAILLAEPILLPAFRPPPPPLPRLSFAALATLMSLGGSLALLTFMLWRWRQVVGHLQRTQASPDWLNDLLETTRCQMRLRRAVRLRLTEQAISPAVCGLFRPLVLLPASLANELPHPQLRAVLLHELVHLRRADVWINCAQALLQIAYWWHPLVWLANARIRRLREEAVDDAVMLALRDEAEIYAPTLLEVAKLAFHRPLASLGLVGILETKRALRNRIERLVDFQAPRRAGLSFVSLLAVVAFTCVAVPQGQAPPKPTPPAAETASLKGAAESGSLFESQSQPASGERPDDGLTYEKFRQQVRQQFIIEGLGSKTMNDGADSVLSEDSISHLWGSAVPLEALTESASLVEEAAVLFEFNKLPEAAAKLNAALKLNPKNQAAYYYWNRLRQDGLLPPRMRRFATNSIGSPYFLVRLNGSTNLVPIAEVLNQLSEKAFQGEILYDGPVFAHGENLFANQDGPSSNRAANTTDSASPKAALHDPGLSRPRTVETSNVQQKRLQSSKVQQKILQKLDSIRLEQINFDDLPLSEVVRIISAETRKHDPDGVGLNFILSPDMDSGGVNRIDPASGLPISSVAPAVEGPDIGAVRVKLASALLDVRLGDLLDIIVKSADRPPGTFGIKYSVKDYGVVLSWRPRETVELMTRTFRLDSNTFTQGLERTLGAVPGSLRSTNGVGAAGSSRLYHDPSDPPAVARLARTNSTSNVSAAIRSLFESCGVDLAPPKAVYWKDRQGILLVRATMQDLDVIERTIQVLNNPPPQIAIKAKFIEIPSKSGPTFWKSLGATNNATSPATLLLDSTQAAAALKSLKSQKGAEILNEMSVTTLSGRQTQLQISDLQTVVTQVTNGVKEPTFLTDSVPMGPTLDLLPNLVPDSWAIELRTVATVNEFLGYDQPAKNEWAEVLVAGKPTKVKPPLPRFRTSQTVVTNSAVLDGQTLVLGNLQSVELSGDKIVKPLPRTEAAKKTLVVFITPTLVDPAGNPYGRKEQDPIPSNK